MSFSSIGAVQRLFVMIPKSCDRAPFLNGEHNGSAIEITGTPESAFSASAGTDDLQRHPSFHPLVSATVDANNAINLKRTATVFPAFRRKRAWRTNSNALAVSMKLNTTFPFILLWNKHFFLPVSSRFVWSRAACSYENLLCTLPFHAFFWVLTTLERCSVREESWTRTCGILMRFPVCEYKRNQCFVRIWALAAMPCSVLEQRGVIEL